MKFTKTICFISVFILTIATFTKIFVDNTNKKDTVVKEQEIYVLDKFNVLDLASFTYNIELTNTQTYGKAYFFNNSSEPVTMYVDGNRVEESIVIPKNSGKYITWTKGGIGNKTYEASIHSNGKATLNGYFSLSNNNNKPYK